MRNITECQLFLTRKCNLSCSYCRVIKHKLSRELTIEEWKKAFDIMQSLGIKTVKIMGGEPLIVKGIEKLLKYITEHTDIKYAILSNSVFSERKMDALVGAGLQGYFASVDEIHSKPTNDRIKKSGDGLNALFKLQKRGVPLLAANVVISKKNLTKIPNIVKYLSRNGFWVNLCPVQWGKEDYWQFRGKDEAGLHLTEEDYPVLERIVHRLIRLKREGVKIAVSESYLEGMPTFINLNWRCSQYSQLRIDADGSLMGCPDIKSHWLKGFDIFYIENQEHYKVYQAMWVEGVKSCPGCYWSSVYLAEENLLEGREEFYYHEKVQTRS